MGSQKILPVTNLPFIEFSSNEFQEYGFDPLTAIEWVEYYDTLSTNKYKYYIPFKSVGINTSDEVDAIFHNQVKFSKDSLEFFIEKLGIPIRFLVKDDSTTTLILPKRDKNYSILARYKGKVLGKLNVIVYAPKIEHITLIPLTDSKINLDSLEKHLNKIYRQANVQFRIDLKPLFHSDKIDPNEALSNPSPNHDRYSQQMRDYRDQYFQTFPTARKRSNYIFIVKGFTDHGLTGYSVKKKALSFIKEGTEKRLAIRIAKQLGFGIGLLNESWKNGGPTSGSTYNLMDIGGGTYLTYPQWESIRHGTKSYSLYDNYEDVVTNNGTVAYYFWREDKKGNFIVESNSILESLKRPFKKNYKSYHLDIRDVFYKPLFHIFKFPINLWHILSSLTILAIVFYLQRRFIKRLKRKVRKVGFWKWITRFSAVAVSCFFAWLAFLLIEKGYERFEVQQGRLKVLDHFSTEKAIDEILENKNVKQKNEFKLCSEILINRADRWYVKKKRRVLYFDVITKDGTDSIQIRYRKDSDFLELVTNNYRDLAESHYIVFNYRKENKIVEQRVFNHVGVELTRKLQLEDPAKRILIFVNGYRPTSVGHTFEENFYDVQKYGLEFPNSNNLIYNFDRYDYWRPWQQFDLLFQKRINPSESYYADGHFSVSTSNHQSLINFTTVSSIYPKRCKYKNRHVCYYTTVAGSGLFGSKRIKTADLHKMKPNRKGFRERRENGRVAGRNFIQLCNEIPNKSFNDTIYIVAHSMGYAYSLGMIDEMRGKINFGGFYIIAPENASAGKVKRSEWQEIWQYGSNFNPGKSDAPCLLDGVAPQVMVSGLTADQRCYIPESQYSQKGFFDSHFIGYYSWIFTIEEGEKGYIKQR